MAKGRFKCTKCDRSFSMPAHLARHENALHGAGRHKTGAVSKTTKRRGRPPSRGGLGSGFNAGALDLVQRMQGFHAHLVAERHSLDEKISAVARAMEAMGTRGSAAPVRRGPGRPLGSGGGRGSLATHIVRALKARNTAMAPREIAQAVLRAGYKTKSQNLTKAVSNALPKLKMVKRFGFGKYRA